MNIFINPNEHRFRSGWRLAAQFFLMFLIAGGLIWSIHQLFTISGNRWPIYCNALAALVSVFLAARGLDKRSWYDYGLRFNKKSVVQYVGGFLLAGGVMAIIFLIEYGAGWVSFTGFGWQKVSNGSYLLSLGGYFLFMLIVGFYEELVFRGYQIVNLSEGLHGKSMDRIQAVIAAVLISSIIFGLVHALNPNAGWISTINVALAGGMLAFPFIITGRLSLSIGVHIGWNFFQGGIFGFPVSGVLGRVSLLQIDQKGPVFITGGGFGPEAGLMGLLGLLLIIGGIMWYSKKSNQPVHIYPGLGIYRPSTRNYPT